MKTVAFLFFVALAVTFGQDKGDMSFSIKSKKEGDFGIDSASLSIKKFNVATPVCWQAKLYLNDSAILDTSACDSDIDQFFKDTLYVSGCKDYESCKIKWYTVDFKNQIIRPGNADFAKPRIDLLTDGYTKKGLKKTESRMRAKKVAQQLSNGKVSLFMPSWAPEGRNEFPKVYDRKIKGFIDVNEW
jgi:hypothetical protein